MDEGRRHQGDRRLGSPLWEREAIVGHPGLAWLRRFDAGRTWLDRLPDLVRECADRWELRVEDPYRNAFTSLVAPARLRDGTGVVLKIQWPEAESEHEAAALAIRAGDASVRLLQHDPDRRALLIERCEPGTPLSRLQPDQALEVAVGLLPRLWKPAESPFRSLADEAARWETELPRDWEGWGRPLSAAC